MLLTVALLAVAASARAEDPNRVAAAMLLFDEGVRALDAGHLDEACSKLAKSQELAPSGGTLLALGECHERAGRFASAWVAYRSAASRAAAAGKSDAEASALEHASKLEPKIARLTLTASPSAPPNLELLRDGAVVSSSELGVGVPVDPGEHEIHASAPGAASWSTKVTIAPGAEATVEVPPLEPTGALAVEDDTGRTQRLVGVVAAGAGAGALIGGTVFGLLAMSSNDAGEAKCNAAACTPAGDELIQEASSRATISTLFFVVGAALLAGGTVLYFTAPKPRHGAHLDWSTATLRW
ncbi:MAG: hypothetical protein KIT84_14495 [Labilithrix sp.]|nr:hypothetical protein [Labilithrix sp.]MCW5812231.1 hypothetical protein [Labilithrix sp.]